MSTITALRDRLFARKGEAAPSLARASFNDPSLAWGDAPPPPMTWEDTPAAGLTAPSARRDPSRRSEALITLPGGGRPKVRNGRVAFTARLPEDLHRRLKLRARAEGTAMTALVAEAVEAWLRRGA